MSKTVATHSGVFHADDVFAVATLSLAGQLGSLVRTRDPKVIDAADFAVDVGGEYAPLCGRFDHHQTGGGGLRPNGVPYAAFGLVWATYGEKLAGSAALALQLDEDFVQFIDAGDTAYTTHTPVLGDGPRTLTSIISGFNPGWNSAVQDFDLCFAQAMAFASGVLTREIERSKDAALAQALTLAAVGNAMDPRLIVLDRFHPWGDVLEDDPCALYVAFPSETGDWRLQCVPVKGAPFGSKRKALPLAWKALRGADFAAATGVVDAVFCHDGLFICGAKSREGVLKLAELALAAK